MKQGLLLNKILMNRKLERNVNLNSKKKYNKLKRNNNKTSNN